MEVSLLDTVCHDSLDLLSRGLEGLGECALKPQKELPVQRPTLKEAICAEYASLDVARVLCASCTE